MLFLIEQRVFAFDELSTATRAPFLNSPVADTWERRIVDADHADHADHARLKAWVEIWRESGCAVHPKNDLRVAGIVAAREAEE